MWAYAHVYMFMYVCTCVRVHLDARGQHQTSFSVTLHIVRVYVCVYTRVHMCSPMSTLRSTLSPSYFLRWGLSLNRELTILPDCLSDNTQHPPVSASRGIHYRHVLLCLAFYVDTEGLSTGLHACAASAFLTEPKNQNFKDIPYSQLVPAT